MTANQKPMATLQSQRWLSVSYLTCNLQWGVKIAMVRLLKIIDRFRQLPEPGLKTAGREKKSERAVERHILVNWIHEKNASKIPLTT